MQADIERVELLFHASQMASTLRLDLNILPISASLLVDGQISGGLDRHPAAATLDGQSAAESRLPLLDISEIGVSATAQLVG